MPDENPSGDWYVRARGRVLGPLTWAQLQSLRDRSQLARFHEVSRDRQSWVGADSLVQLFPKAEAGPGPDAHGSRSPAGLAEFLVVDEAPANPPGLAPAADFETPIWYIARSGSHHGPVPLSELKRMAAGGEIGPDTLLWRNGMAQWAPGSHVAELGLPNPVVGSAGPTGGPSPAHRARTSPRAFAGLVLGSLWLGGIGSLAAIVLGPLALRQIARSQGTLTGRGLAVIVMVLGILGLAISLAAIFAFVEVRQTP